MPGAVHAAGDVAVDQQQIARRFARQRHHDRRAGAGAEQNAPLFAQATRALRPQFWIGERFGRVAAQAGQRRRDRVEIGHHVAFAAAERGEAERRQIGLQRRQVLAAQRQIVGEVARRREKIVAHDGVAPAADEAIGLAPHPLAQGGDRGPRRRRAGRRQDGGVEFEGGGARAAQRNGHEKITRLEGAGGKPATLQPI